jgi:ATP/maltotriose-dependent transcriptional regulator MalT
LEQPIVEGINGEAKALDDVKQASVTVKEIKAAARAAAPDAPAPETEITTQHVQMINGDLHIDGEKLETETVVQRAAKTGDMSAAIIAPKVKAKKPKHTPLEELTKLADKPLPEKHANALKLHSEGKSNRQIEAELHICRKTLKKLFDARGLTANG